MNTTGDRIKVLRESKGLTQEELGKLVGTTKQTIFKYETGKIENIPYSRIEDIAKVFDCAPGDILGWSRENNAEDDAEKSLSIPFISQKISAGYGEDYLSDDSIMLKRIQIPESMARSVSDKATLVSAEVKGDSMIDANIYPGDYVIFHNKLTIISENRNYPTRIVDADIDGVRILGKVVGWIHNELY